MAKSREMQQALDIVAGRKPAAPAARSKWSKLEQVGALLWVGVGIMVIGLAVVFAMG
jgi:hypothetical protein